MNIQALADKLNLQVLSFPHRDVEISGAYVGDLLSKVMGQAKEGNVWITIMTNINVVAVASLVGVSAVIIADGEEISPDVIKVANEQGVNVFRTDRPAFETALDIGKFLNL